MQFDVLSRNLNVFASHFLEASAGTGKTFAIEHLVTRLLIEGDTPLSIEQILVVTFTRAATRELKLRIRRTLAQAKEELTHANPAADYLKAICEKGAAATQMAIKKIDAAMICYDAAQIFTLHGFCHRILKEFAFEAALGMQLADPDENTHLRLLEEMVRDHLKEGVALPDYSPMQIQAVLKKYQREPRRLISSLVDLISSGKEIFSSQSYADILQAVVREIHSLPPIEADRLKADLALLTPHYKKMTDEKFPKQIALLCEMLASKSCTALQFDTLLKGDLFLENMGPDNLKVRAKLPESSSLHYPGLIDQLRSRLLPLIEAAKDSSRIFLRLASDLKEKSRTLFEQRETFSPDALLLRVEAALQMSSFSTRVREKYRAAIIDEFQDTDPIQWNIFQQLFLSHHQAICLVGDPKQSIYAFRNADVYTYLNAAKSMGPDAKKYLDTNYRSTAPLVAALNLLFSMAKGGWMHLPGTKEALEVAPVKAGANLASEDDEAPIQFFIGSGKKGRSKKFPTAEMFESKIFPFIAAKIAALHAERKIAYHDIAILVKDRFQAQEIIAYLKKCHIPASYKRGASLIDSPAYFALKEMLAAVCSPHDLSKVKAALGGPFIAWQEDQIFSSLLEAKAKMQALQFLLFEKGFAPFFQALLNAQWETPRSLLEEMLLRGDVSLYLDLRKLSELLIEEEILQGLKGDAFCTFLEEIAIDAHQDESRLRCPPQEEKGSVMVMTTHMSKGLEFEIVFALGLASRHKLSERVSIRHEGRRVVVPFDPSDPTCQRAVEEQDAEKMRQLYVALTRAKRRLYIPWLIEEEQKAIEYAEAAPIELFMARMIEQPENLPELYALAQSVDLSRAREVLAPLQPLIQSHILEEQTEEIVKAVPSDECALIQPSSLHLPTYHQQLLSFSALAQKDPTFEAVKPPADAPLSPHTLPLGSETGHLLHLLFEKIFKRRLHHPLDEKALFALIEEEVAFTPLEPWQSILRPWIVDLLTKSLGDFALCDVSNFQQEMEFLYPISRGMMKGFADLFFEIKGKYYLLDWKSNYLGPSDTDYTPEKIAQIMQQNQYDLQAAIYTEALQRFVKLFDNRPFSECFGGAIYYFIRGRAVHHFLPKEGYASV